MEPIDRLQWFCRALAQDGNIQVKLFLSPEDPIDELIFGFDEAYTSSLNLPNNLTEEQKATFKRVFDYISKIADGLCGGALEDEALKNSEHWAEIRVLAKTALQKARWSLLQPIPDDNIVTYIDGNTGKKLDV